MDVGHDRQIRVPAPEVSPAIAVQKHPGEELLAERGHDVIRGRVRIAAGRSGVAIGFPNDPLVHLSWWALAGGAFLWRHLKRKRD